MGLSIGVGVAFNDELLAVTVPVIVINGVGLGHLVASHLVQ